MKTAMQAERVIMEWVAEPVLTHLHPRLSAEDRALLTALVSAMSFPGKTPELDQFPVWRDAAALPLE